MEVGDSHPILRRVVLGAQLITLALVAAASAYLGGHGSPDYFQQLAVDALVPLLLGLLVLGIAGFALYRLGRTVLVLIAFDCIVVVGPVLYALLGMASRDIRLFLFALAVASAPIIGAVGAFIVEADRPPRVGPPHT